MKTNISEILLFVLLCNALFEQVCVVSKQYFKQRTFILLFTLASRNVLNLLKKKSFLYVAKSILWEHS